MKTIYSICARDKFFYLPVVGYFTDGTKYQVKGLVKDPAGEAIIGASVVVKGTTNGSITDLTVSSACLTYPREQRLPFRISVTFLKRRKRPLHRDGVYTERRH